MKFHPFSSPLVLLMLTFLATPCAFAQSKLVAAAETQAITETTATDNTPKLSEETLHAGKVLVTFNPLPTGIEYEVIGPISVYKRWFGGIGTAMQSLARKPGNWEPMRWLNRASGWHRHFPLRLHRMAKASLSASRMQRIWKRWLIAAVPGSKNPIAPRQEQLTRSYLR